MKKHFKKIVHNPKIVVVVSLVIALVVGLYGYKKIHTIPGDIFTGDTSISGGTVPSNQNLTLGFLSGGRIASVSVKAGDTVRKGQVLASLDAGNALGALTQAKAAYATAQANYTKVLNGATGTAIDVAKAGVNTAKVNLEGITNQQNLLVKNAHTNLLNSTVTAKPVGDTSLTPPSISGAYTDDTEGTITISVVQTGSGGYFSMTGMVSGTGNFSTATPEPISDTGLFIQFPSANAYVGSTWEITIPNTTAPNYLANYNAYQSALQSKTQAIATAQAALDQANASLTAMATAARPEDVAAAQAQVENASGAVQIAQATYANTIITAPTDGTITSVNIAPGQIAIPNAPAIEFISSNVSN